VDTEGRIQVGKVKGEMKFFRIVIGDNITRGKIDWGQYYKR